MVKVVRESTLGAEFPEVYGIEEPGGKVKNPWAEGDYPSSTSVGVCEDGGLVFISNESAGSTTGSGGDKHGS